MLTYAPIPTTDLYFLNSCGDLVARPWRRAPVTRLGANVFRVGNRYLVVRRDREKVIRQVLAKPDAEIIYLIDDNLEALEDQSLPDGYRERLRALKTGTYAEMLERATLVVTSAQDIAASLPAGKRYRILDPVWHGQPREASHLPTRPAQHVDMVHLGTGSHAAGFGFLAPVLKQVLEQAAHAHFHYFSNMPQLGGMDGHPRVHRQRAKTWNSYKRALPGFRFDLGLYPLPSTPFNAARSKNKILEYTLAGCPAMYSAAWGSTHGLVDGQTAFLSEEGQEAWIKRLLDVLAAPDVLGSVYNGAKMHFKDLNDLPGQRAFWQSVFIKDSK
ncbi:hypothetical protein [Kordiimonas aestuarii]|uniref:hypothetical protein n=1 Tax=Kordiimonas aestuarii TaxID=1005925 RepID=UPI0021CE891F|nr:hypothetical protein [Kordiimonas aestuarii]